ncbi:GNAT superfamily N-acetyltransferase [Arcanobacterium wilhelmae]|uniref:GNAT superfamily N-acetyltransferase n=1 Tax=Arcanobacterium wilhelmae TaxID=1803177 RepID=A0ABT9N8M0_9ACTO|nr:GNAT family N-acetyltransferase [Arcanobacterium wilhelmae]MDP9800047.1 GNAT superfamily N-acetyltransferase [Arcanobacterium wilhelmae]WFN89542.1 GNAT family N-acetyltransferase [Arcanobacterium wilhelmae]
MQGRVGGRILVEESDRRFGVRLVEKNGERELIATGDPTLAIATIRRLRADQRPDISTLTTQIRQALDPDLAEFLGPEWGYRWEFWYAQSPLAELPGSERVAIFPRGTDELAEHAEQIRAALAASNPISDANENFDKLSWFVAFSEEHEVAAVMGYETLHSQGKDFAYFHGLGTLPQFRGRGYASLLMVGAVNLALTTHDAIHFGMWAWNEGAGRIYKRVGLINDAHLIEGRREPFVELG